MEQDWSLIIQWSPTIFTVIKDTRALIINILSMVYGWSRWAKLRLMAVDTMVWLKMAQAKSHTLAIGMPHIVVHLN